MPTPSARVPTTAARVALALALVFALSGALVVSGCGGAAEPRATRDAGTGGLADTAVADARARDVADDSGERPHRPDATTDAAPDAPGDAPAGDSADLGPSSDVPRPLDVLPPRETSGGGPDARPPDAAGGPADAAEPPPVLVVTPLEVDFGHVPAGTVARVPVRLANEGRGVLRIRSVRLLFGSHAGLHLEGTPDAPVEVAPGAAYDVEVVWHWTEPPPRSDARLGTVLVAANHSLEDFGRIPVYARYDWPVARLAPKDELSFGEVVQGATGLATAVLRNAGEAPLNVSEILVEAGEGALPDEFGVQADETFPPTAGARPGVVPPRSERELVLRFTNRGAADGAAEGWLTVRTDDEQAPELHVRLLAERSGDPVCAIELDPALVDFGTLPEYGEDVRRFELRNVGSGYCSFVNATIATCVPDASDLGRSRCLPDAGIDSRFRVLRGPVAAAQGLAPGSRTPIDVVYAPGEAGAYAALLSVTVDDPYAPAGQSGLFVVPARPAAGEAQPPNLVGRCARCPLDVIPAEVDFGPTTLACPSTARRVTVYSTDSSVPLAVVRIAPDSDCGPAFEFTLPPIPPAGVPVDVGAPFSFTARFRPQTAGEHRCHLIVETTDPCRPVLRVPFSGEGTTDTGRSETFVQEAVHEVDVLFVVDDSGSMCEDQNNLAANIHAFLQHAQTWSSDYRLGVVSLCVDDRSCPAIGGLRTSSPPQRWVDRHSWQHFADNVVLGCDGGSDAQEAGLEAAWLALSPPNSTLSLTSCHEDSYCVQPQRCLLDIEYCGGPNGGFVRDDASLEVVILSDEEDQSPRPVDYYVDFLKSLKGYVNDHMLHVHSIIDRAVGQRYAYVSEHTGGQVASIVDQSFANALSELGAAAFGLRRRFYLTGSPVPETLTVTVDGTPRPTGWVYEPAANAIHFGDDAATLPQEGQTIEVAYESSCGGAP